MGQDEAYYQVLARRATRASMARGKFFVGVKTTGIYRRPVCPRPAQARRNVEFFPDARAAGKRGLPALPALPSRGRA